MTHLVNSQSTASEPPSLKRRMSPRTLFSRGMTAVAFACAAIALLPLIAVLSYIVIKGAARVNLELFTELPPPPLVEGGGFGNAILGTLITVGIGAAISVPLGVLAAIYLSEFARDSRLAAWVDFFNNVLSGVPSIVVGVFAYGVIVLATGSFSAVAGGVALAVLMLPIIVRTAAESLESVPPDVRQASVGLGATDFQTVTRVILPAAIPAIVTGVMLAVARAAGETAPLLFTALSSQYWLRGLWSPTPTLSVLVFNYATAPYDNQQELAWAGSLVLVALVLVTSILARWASRRQTY